MKRKSEDTLTNLLSAISIGGVNHGSKLSELELKKVCIRKLLPYTETQEPDLIEDQVS
jgi:hypothetical protein